MHSSCRKLKKIQLNYYEHCGCFHCGAAYLIDRVARCWAGRRFSTKSTGWELLSDEDSWDSSLPLSPRSQLSEDNSSRVGADGTRWLVSFWEDAAGAAGLWARLAAVLSKPKCVAYAYEVMS